MDSVILQGPDAIKAAKWLMRALDTEAYDLGPDFGQDTARVWMFVRTEKPVDWVAAVVRWQALGWFDGVGVNFRAIFDGPPFRMGSDISVVGTPL
jgi:hypothetical protein